MNQGKIMQLLVYTLLLGTLLALPAIRGISPETEEAYTDFIETVSKIMNSEKKSMALIQVPNANCHKISKRAEHTRRKLARVTNHLASLGECATSTKRIIGLLHKLNQAKPSQNQTFIVSLLDKIGKEFKVENLTDVSGGFTSEIDYAFNSLVSSMHLQLFEAVSDETQSTAKQIVRRFTKLSNFLENAKETVDGISQAVALKVQSLAGLQKKCEEKSSSSTAASKSAPAPQKEEAAPTPPSSAAESTKVQDKAQDVTTEPEQTKTVHRRPKFRILNPVDSGKAEDKAKAHDPGLAPMMGGDVDGVDSTETTIQITNLGTKSKASSDSHAAVATSDISLATQDKSGYNRPKEQEKKARVLSPVLAKKKSEQSNQQAVISAPFAENLAEDD
jgi:hypothetical protein